MDRKEKFEKIIPYNVVLMMIYYGCPLFMSSEGLAMIMMLAVMPVAVFFCSFFLGLKVGLSAVFLLLAAVTFLPSYWVYLTDWEALGFYLIFFLVIEAVGMILGWLINKIVRKMLER